MAGNDLRRRAYVAVVDGDYLKVEVPGLAAAGHAYLYFPTLTWCFWESHPFSVVLVSGGQAAGGASW